MSSSPLEFGGQERFDVSADRVLATATSFDVLPRLLPDVESSERVDDRTLRCVVRPGFSFLRGKLTVTITRQDTAEPQSASFTVHSKGIGAQVVVETTLRVESTGGDDHPASASLHWQARVTQLSGLVAAVSTSLVRAAAEQVIGQVWQRLRAELTA